MGGVGLMLGGAFGWWMAGLHAPAAAAAPAIVRQSRRRAAAALNALPPPSPAAGGAQAVGAAGAHAGRAPRRVRRLHCGARNRHHGGSDGWMRCARRSSRLRCCSRRHSHSMPAARLRPPFPVTPPALPPNAPPCPAPAPAQAYTASALSLMLAGFRKPIVMTGSQLPLALPRSDARQNLLDSMCCATASFSPPHVHLQGKRAAASALRQALRRAASCCRGRSCVVAEARRR